jgi:hypothetical protein
MRLQDSGRLAASTAILAAACFMSAPADARVSRDGAPCYTAGAHKKKIPRQVRMHRAERRRLAHGERAGVPWHGWGTSFHLDGVRYPGGNPHGPAAWYNNWEGGFHPVAFWVLQARNMP